MTTHGLVAERPFFALPPDLLELQRQAREFALERVRPRAIQKIFASAPLDMSHRLRVANLIAEHGA